MANCGLGGHSLALKKQSEDILLTTDEITSRLKGQIKTLNELHGPLQLTTLTHKQY